MIDVTLLSIDLIWIIFTTQIINDFKHIAEIKMIQREEKLI